MRAAAASLLEHRFGWPFASSHHRSTVAINARQWSLQMCPEFSNCCGRFCPCQGSYVYITWQIKHSIAFESQLLPEHKLYSIRKGHPTVDGRRKNELIKIPEEKQSRITQACKTIERSKYNRGWNSSALPGVDICAQYTNRWVESGALLTKLLTAEILEKIDQITHHKKKIAQKLELQSRGNLPGSSHFARAVQDALHPIDRRHSLRTSDSMLKQMPQRDTLQCAIFEDRFEWYE